MPNLKYKTNSIYQLEDPTDNKFSMIKTYRDMNVIKTTSKLTPNPANYYFSRIKPWENYLKLFYLLKPIFDAPVKNNFKYIASTIFYHNKDTESYLADFYIADNKEKICMVYGTEQDFCISETSIRTMKKRYKDLYTLIINEKLLNYKDRVKLQSA